MISDRQVQKIVNFFKQESVEVVYLFGSQASGKAHAHSDYDFGILFSDNLSPSEQFKKRLEYIGEIGKIVGSESVDVVNLKSATTSLQYAAIFPRRDIITKNEAKRVTFEHTAMSMYFDRQPSLTRHSLASISSIAQNGL